MYYLSTLKSISRLFIIQNNKLILSLFFFSFFFIRLIKAKGKNWQPAVYYANIKPLKDRRIQFTVPKLSKSLRVTDSSSSPCHHLFRNVVTSRLHYSWHHSMVSNLTECEHCSQQVPLAHFLRYCKILCFLVKSCRGKFFNR